MMTGWPPLDTAFFNGLSSYSADLSAHMSVHETPLETVRGIIDTLRADRASHEQESP